MEEDTLYDKVTLPYTDLAPKAGETPFFLVLLLLIFFPPAAWYIMWREKEYHRWFAYLIGLYGVLTIIGSIIIQLVLIPQSVKIYQELGLIQPKISPFSFVPIYIVLGILELTLAALLFVIGRKHTDLPKNWLIIGLIALAFNSLVQPVTQVILTYSAFRSIYQQEQKSRTLYLSPTPTATSTPTPTPLIPSPKPTFSSKVSPTCRPRPACLDAKPKCLIAETSDMCPASSSATTK